MQTTRIKSNNNADLSTSRRLRYSFALCHIILSPPVMPSFRRRARGAIIIFFLSLSFYNMNYSCFRTDIFIGLPISRVPARREASGSVAVYEARALR